MEEEYAEVFLKFCEGSEMDPDDMEYMGGDGDLDSSNLTEKQVIYHFSNIHSKSSSHTISSTFCRPSTKASSGNSRDRPYFRSKRSKKKKGGVNNVISSLFVIFRPSAGLPPG